MRVIIVLLLSYFGLQQRWWQVEGWYWNIWEWRLGVTWNRTYVGSTNWGIFTAPRTTFPTRWHNTQSHIIRYGHDRFSSLCILCILHSQPVGLLCTTDTSHWAIFENQIKICPSLWQVEGWDWNKSEWLGVAWNRSCIRWVSGSHIWYGMPKQLALSFPTITTSYGHSPFSSLWILDMWTFTTSRVYFAHHTGLFLKAR